MEIDTSRVLTDEYRDAIKRLFAGNLTKEEFEEILHQLTVQGKGISKDQYERIFQLESAEEIINESVSTAFAVGMAKTIISARIQGHLNEMDNLPDKMAELERLASNEMHSEVAYVEHSLADSLPLTTSEVVRLYVLILSDNHERLEKEFDLLRRTKERKEALGISDVNKAEYELTGEEKLLADICPLFGNATRDTRATVWKIMLKFSRKQWAYFADLTKLPPQSNNTERARRLQEICGKTGLRDLFNKQATVSDKMAVNKVITLLRADGIKAQIDNVPLAPPCA